MKWNWIAHTYRDEAKWTIFWDFIVGFPLQRRKPQYWQKKKKKDKEKEKENEGKFKKTKGNLCKCNFFFIADQPWSSALCPSGQASEAFQSQPCNPWEGACGDIQGGKNHFRKVDFCMWFVAYCSVMHFSGVLTDAIQSSWWVLCWWGRLLLPSALPMTTQRR